MYAIETHELRKIFSLEQRQSGIIGAVKSLFYRKKTELEAVKGITFKIAHGEFVGFVGPNGAGKTTTLKMLSGILHPTSGSAHVLGRIPWKREKDFQRRFALVMGQKNQLWWDLPVRETFAFNKVVYEIPDAVFHKQHDTLVELLDIGRLLSVQARKLSLGERMKCELAAALLHKPEILFLDEPTIGLDVVSQKNIRDFLRSYNKNEKATIILTSHYMEDIRRLCDRVMIIDRGALIYDGDYRELVEKHADTKTIEILFNDVVDRNELATYGRIADFKENGCRLIVPRARVTEVTTQILKSLPVEDISIQEETMEEIVSELFSQNKKTS